jgi:hypothetical protein
VDRRIGNINALGWRAPHFVAPECGHRALSNEWIVLKETLLMASRVVVRSSTVFDGLSGGV